MWMFANKFEGDVRLDGKTVVITGGNSGIGKETVKDLYKRGARIVMLCRDQEKAKLAIEEIKNEFEFYGNTGQLFTKYIDLSDLTNVRSCANELLVEEAQINLLINNAGLLGHPERKTKDNLDMHFCVNYLSHFLLTLLLLPTIIKSSPSRIINVSSMLHQGWYGAELNLDDIHFNNRKHTNYLAYCQSKLANLMFTEELRKRIQAVSGLENKVTTYALHPGVIVTEIVRNFNVILFGFMWFTKYICKWFLITPAQGAQTTLYCALDEKLEKQSSIYYSNCKQKDPDQIVFDENKSLKLWDMSIQLVGLQNYDPFQKLNHKDSGKITIN